MKNFDDRLKAAADFARHGKRFADIGTDHAYLPIWLCENGISPGGVASDVNDGPVERAVKNINSVGLNDRIAVIKTDGLDGIDEYTPEDVFILGMGGDLISDILRRSDFIRNPDIRLILQPMTHADVLRQMLDEHGFYISDETVIRDGPRFYQIICAGYDGNCRQSAPEELIAGKINILRSTDTFREFASYISSVYEKKVSGMSVAGLDCSREKELAEKFHTLSVGK